MKVKLMIAAGILVILCAGAGWAEAAAEQPRITVNGEAVVYAQPDKVTVNFGVETWDNSIAAAKKKNNDVMKHTFAAIRDLGVENKDVQTDYLNI